MYWYRAFRPRWLWRLTSPFGKPTSRYVKANGFTVKRGPFQGLLYPEESLGHTNYLSSKLMGAYEPQVVEFLSRHAGAADVFADVGSGDGFFCVGIARSAPIHVVGFETNKFERNLADRIARSNNVTFESRGLAGEEELNSLPPGKKLILSDVEGFEEDLLDPASVPCLLEATMLVEVHEQFRPNVVEVLTQRFGATHQIDRLYASPVAPQQVPEVAGWDKADAEIALFDGHGAGDSWMTFVPR